MNTKVLSILEYHKIIDRLLPYAGSEGGKKLVRELTPSSELETVNQALTETESAVGRILVKDAPSFGSNYDIREALKALKIEANLSCRELLNIAGVLECTRTLVRYGAGDKEDAPADALTPIFAGLTEVPSLLTEIRGAILAEDEYADDASPKLKDIRRQMVVNGDRIHTQLNSLINTHRSYLQDAVITMRDNRYCIPVKAEYKSSVPGMIHDQSSTGSTFFIEPQAIVDLNNKLKELAIEEKEEIARILAELSAKAMEVREILAEDTKLLSRLDFIFAKARLALSMNAMRPTMNDRRIIRILKGRHPLLDPNKVVPIDVRLGDDFRLLVITGPNTGGKTVTLKTVGLFTLMAQAGLFVPAASNTELAVFRKVYADIGDEQSIEQSLSTFSAHMTNIVTILKHCDEDSLCLFDELGAGTDPTEGAALAIAILNHLHERGIRTMATTHYSELKIYALSTDGVENAGCEFDVNSLRPTYRLLIGIPGKSNAFAISSRLGLPPQIITKAKEQLSSEDESFEDVISDLEKTRVRTEKDRLAIAAERREVEQLRKDLKAQQQRLEESRDSILRKANEEAREILQEAKDTADETISRMQKLGKENGIKEAERSRQDLHSRIKDKNNALSVKEEPKTHKTVEASDLKPGTSVKILSSGLKGTVSGTPDAKGNVTVQCGIMKSTVKLTDLVIIDDVPDYLKDKSGNSPTKSKHRFSGNLSKASTISFEINLLGKTVDEAIAELDKYLDDAYLSHLPTARIVHGKGTGALRNAVQSHLKRVSYVKSYRNGEIGEGDAGVTIVEFK